MTQLAQRILGIDPGFVTTGYAVIEGGSRNPCLLTSGTIDLQGDLATRLQLIFNSLTEVIAEHKPEIVSIETIFYHRNAEAVLKLGQARGAAVCAAAVAGLPICEYGNRVVKKTIVGKGNADKRQVQYMAARLLQVAERTSDDEADAMAIALCHTFSTSNPLLAKMKEIK